MAGNKMGNKTKAKILDTAKEMFSAYGYENTKVDDIAEKAGLTKAMLYYHFGSKENIMTALVNSLINEISEKFTAFFNDKAMTTQYKLESHIIEMINFWQNNTDSVRIIMTASINHPEYIKSFSESLNSLYNNFNEDTDNELSSKAIQNMFFFNTIPMIIYPLFSTQVAKQNNIDDDTSNKVFAEQFAKVLLSTIYN